MAEGYLSLVLHSHLPFVRHPEYERFLEEDWLFEAITETYIPLLGVFERLEADGIPFRMTVSVSPTLVEMLRDQLLQERYEQHLSRLIRLAESELERTQGSEENRLAELYLEHFQHCRTVFSDKFQRNLLDGLLHFKKSGSLELITSSATHGFLPLLQVVPRAVNAQIEVAVRTHKKAFGSAPEGIWLPECGYYPGLEEILQEYGLGYFFLETHGILYADTRPQYGVYAPLFCPNQVAAFGRDPESAKAVWSSKEGYPGDPLYREFYRDIGFDLPLEYIKPYLPPDATRVYTGIKYYAITGRTEKKKFYNPQKALAKVNQHARDFLNQRLLQINRLSEAMDRPPLLVCPYDAELFGHWWYEGPYWIEQVLRGLAEFDDKMELLSPSDYLGLYIENQVAQPCFSSWGNKGYAEVWLEGSNDWIYRHLHTASDRMVELSRRFPDEKGTRGRALNQAARELLLSQSSDWAFIMKTGTTVPYAVKRTREHISNFNNLYQALMRNEINQEWLLDLEKKNNCFADIDYRVYCP